MKVNTSLILKESNGNWDLLDFCMTFQIQKVIINMSNQRNFSQQSHPILYKDAYD